MDNNIIARENAHHTAQKLLTDEFFFSLEEDSAPFGNEDGLDAFNGFKQWHSKNKVNNSIQYIHELLDELNYPEFDLHELDPEKIKEYIEQKTESDNLSINDQIPIMLDQIKQMASASGKEFDEDKIKEMMLGTSEDMGTTFLLGQDNSIIAVAFGQLILEGRIDKGLHELVEIALQRQLLPVLIDKWDEEYQEVRKAHLNKMLEVIKKVV